jgi:hypothetical protein
MPSRFSIQLSGSRRRCADGSENVDLCSFEGITNAFVQSPVARPVRLWLSDAMYDAVKSSMKEPQHA